jgi:hypothetical protein
MQDKYSVAKSCTQAQVQRGAKYLALRSESARGRVAGRSFTVLDRASGFSYCDLESPETPATARLPRYHKRQSCEREKGC